MPSTELRSSIYDTFKYFYNNFIMIEARSLNVGQAVAHDANNQTLWLPFPEKSKTG